MKKEKTNPAKNGGTSRENAVPPLSEAEVEKKFRSEGKERVPAKLADIGQPEFAPYEFAGVSREKLAKTKAVVLEPMRPEWVASVHIPKKARVPNKPRAIEHRGRLLEPGLVFSPDDRRTYNDRSYPWGTVCKVVTAMGWGSGVIVGPRHVLTASHVVDWSRDGAGSVEVHRAGGSAAAIAAITRVWFYTKVTGTVSWLENDEDYAVLITSSRIGDRFGWLGTRTYDSDWDGDSYWYSIGYPGDIGSGNTPVWQRRKWLDEDAWDWGGGRSMETDTCCMPLGILISSPSAREAGSANRLAKSCSPGCRSVVATCPVIVARLDKVPAATALAGSTSMATNFVSASAGVPLGISAVTTSTFAVSIPAMARRSAPLT